MKVRIDRVRPICFSEDDHQMTVQYSNRGYPFRQGVEFMFDRLDGGIGPIWVLLNRDEVRVLRDKLNEFLGDQNEGAN